MASTFEQAIPVLMAHEGGWVDDPQDPGGETNYGWSMLTIERLGLTPRDLGIDQDKFTPGCLKLMTADTAQALYRKYFWNRYGYGAIANQTAATKVFDAAVNMGPSRAAVFAQNVCNAQGHQVSPDGVLGPISFAAINAIDGATFVRAYAQQMTDYYLAVIAAHPNESKFKSNWLHRAQWGV